MTKVNLDIPDSLHRKVRQLQLDLEEQEQKFSLKDLYYHVIEKGLMTIEKEKSGK